MDSIENFEDFKKYVAERPIDDEDVVFDILGFVIAKNDKKWFKYFVNECLNSEILEL